MYERATTGIALTVAIGVVGGAFLLLRRPKPLVPRIVAQRSIPGHKALPPRVQIDLAPSSALRNLSAEGKTWEYRVVDAEGRIHLSSPNADENTRTLFVAAAYARPAPSPRLEVWVDGELRGTSPLAPLPAPAVASLDVGRSPKIRARHVVEPDASGWMPAEGNWGRVRFEACRPIPPGETWTVEILRTTLQDHPMTLAHLGTQLKPTGMAGRVDDFEGYASLRYADDVTGLEVRVLRTVQRRQTWPVQVRGLRLVERGGQTLLVGGRTAVPGSSGLDVRSNDGALYAPPSSKPAGGAPPAAGTVVKTVYARLTAVFSKGRQKPDERLNSPRFFLDEASRKALRRRSLDLDEYGSWDSKGKPSPLLLGKPFDVTVTVEKRWSETSEGFRATIPVEPARRS